MTNGLDDLDLAHAVLVGGKWLSGRGGRFDVHDPANLDLVARVSDGDTADATAAVDAAYEAFQAWRTSSARTRSEVLQRAFELMIRDREWLSETISRENGKSRQDAASEVGYAAEFFRWYAEEAVRSGGSYGPAPVGGARTVVSHKPVGVAALITPWNFPAAMATRKIAPALATGCTVVLKPAAETPITAIAIARILAEAGVPDGVVNVVPTTDANGVVSAWMRDDRVRKVSFTGSTGVGRLLLHQAADRIVNSSMELGGNAPFLVAGDADVPAAVAGAMVAKFRNGGQACTAANRFYVHSSVFDEFVERFGESVEALRVGPASSGAEIGPLISERALRNIESLVQGALGGGARISHRADVAETRGHFYPPTVLVDVASDAPIVSHEIFGPVAPVISWSDEAEVIDLANATEMGLAAYVYAGELRHAMQVAERLDAGMVGINRGVVSDPSAPFGGVKQSGLGREGGRFGLEEFQEVQYLSVDWSN